MSIDRDRPREAACQGRDGRVGLVRGVAAAELGDPPMGFSMNAIFTRLRWSSGPQSGTPRVHPRCMSCDRLGLVSCDPSARPGTSLFSVQKFFLGTLSMMTMGKTFLDLLLKVTISAGSTPTISASAIRGHWRMAAFMSLSGRPPLMWGGTSPTLMHTSTLGVSGWSAAGGASRRSWLHLPIASRDTMRLRRPWLVQYASLVLGV